MRRSWWDALAYLILDQELDTLNGCSGGFLELISIYHNASAGKQRTETAAETPPTKSKCQYYSVVKGWTGNCGSVLRRSVVVGSILKKSTTNPCIDKVSFSCTSEKTQASSALYRASVRCKPHPDQHHEVRKLMLGVSGGLGAAGRKEVNCIPACP